MDGAQFVGETTLMMLKDGVSVRLSPTKAVTSEDDGLDCAGWFCPTDREMVCATLPPYWLETYAHEFCHYTQWKDGVLTDEDEDDIWDWLAGVDKPYATVEKSVRGSQLLEADNERRTVEVIKKYDLPIDVPTYRQKSNAYILLYDVVLKTRRWGSGDHPIYSDPAIYGKLPADRILSDDEFQDAPQWFFDLILPKLSPPPKATRWQRFRRWAKKAEVYDPVG